MALRPTRFAPRHHEVGSWEVRGKQGRGRSVRILQRARSFEQPACGGATRRQFEARTGRAGDVRIYTGVAHASRETGTRLGAHTHGHTPQAPTAGRKQHASANDGVSPSRAPGFVLGPCLKSPADLSHVDAVRQAYQMIIHGSVHGHRRGPPRPWPAWSPRPPCGLSNKESTTAGTMFRCELPDRPRRRGAGSSCGGTQITLGVVCQRRPARPMAVGRPRGSPDGPCSHGCIRASRS